MIKKTCNKTSKIDKTIGKQIEQYPSDNGRRKEYCGYEMRRM